MLCTAQVMQVRLREVIKSIPIKVNLSKKN